MEGEDNIKVDVLRGVANREKEENKNPMAEGSIFAEQDAKARARRIHSRIEELMLAIERYHEMLENFEERLLEIGQEVRATP